MGYEYEFRIDNTDKLARALTSAESFAAASLGPRRDLGGVRSYPIASTDPAGRAGALQFCSTHVLLSVASRHELKSPLVKTVLETLESLGFEPYEEGEPTPTRYDEMG
jgi:hypothetical protein